MAFVAPILGIVGAVASVAGTIASANAQAASANYQAQVARNNAQIAKQNADYAIQAGYADAERQSMAGAQKVAKVKAGIAAGGIDVNQGSAVDVVASEREVNKLDTETGFHSAQLKSYGYRTQATNFEADARLKQLEAKNARTAGAIGALGGIVGGATSVAKSWGGGGFG